MINTPSASPESPEAIKEVTNKLTPKQQAVLDRVLLILDLDPELAEKVTKVFQKNLRDISSDKEKFDLLIEKIDTSALQKLTEIQEAFEKEEGGITKSEAFDKSKAVIVHYTDMKLSTLKAGLNTPIA